MRLIINDELKTNNFGKNLSNKNKIHIRYRHFV